MRQITEDAYSAFKLRERFKSSNTEVRISGDGVYLLLHDNEIAKQTKNGLFLSHAGWPTNTTRERLSPFVNKIRKCEGDIIIEEKVKLTNNWTHYDHRR
ncbi:MAG: hypothetical protein N2B06_08725 [Clostridium sp.]|tara:strand:- start:2903 stop:3199 length:297 start_codon:yes stop_codon:yes gene_type:complete